MAITLAQLGGGSGFVYVTLADGTTIIANIENTSDAWQQVQKYVSAPLTDPTLQVDATFGYRIFGNTAGVAGSLVGATELTRFLVNRASQTARYKTSATIAAGVVTIDRVSNDMLLVVDTEGLAASDDLEVLTVTNVVDNDTVTIVGNNAARIVQVATGGNFIVSDGVPFFTANTASQITVRWFSASATWNEVSRGETSPTVANQRTASVPVPISGVNTTALGAGGGTINLEPGVDKGYQVYTGTIVLVGSWVIQIQPAPATPYLDGDTMIVDYRALATVGANSVTIFGQTLSTAQALAGRYLAKATYKLSITTWYYEFFENNGTGAAGVDMATKPYVDATFEPFLPASPVAGFILSSDGVAPPNQGYNWIPVPSGALLSYQRTFTSAEILTLFSVNGGLGFEAIPAQGAGLTIIIMDAAIKLDYNTVAYTYAGATLDLLYNGGTQPWTFIGSALSQGADYVTNGIRYNNIQLLENTPLYFRAVTSNPTLGNGTLTLNIVYRILNSPSLLP